VAELLDKHQQNIEVTDSPETFRDSPKRAVEPENSVPVEWQDREQFAKTSRGNTRAVERFDVALENSL
jgi:hypothetical protein